MGELPKIPGPGQVHVWSLNLRLHATLLRRLRTFLSVDERDRAARFVFPRHRERYIAGRGFLRLLLAHYLSEAPEALAFGQGPAGKPFLLTPSAGAQLHFNVAHCEDLAVLVVGSSAPLGVDIERVREFNDAASLVRYFFSQREAAAFCLLPRYKQPEAFFNLWTRKEALLKATGEGIAHSLNLVEVGFLPGDPPVIRSLPEDFGEKQDWTLASLPAPAGFTTALAVRAPFVELLHYSPPTLLDSPILSFGHSRAVTNSSAPDPEVLHT